MAMARFLHLFFVGISGVVAVKRRAEHAAALRGWGIPGFKWSFGKDDAFFFVVIYFHQKYAVFFQCVFFGSDFFRGLLRIFSMVGLTCKGMVLEDYPR